LAWAGNADVLCWGGVQFRRPAVLVGTAMVKVTGAFQKSSEIMKATNQLIKLPELSATMRQMSMEMMKVSLV
jgi:division protein CdvB (Snf7/Vps24/ESCRT-III family)